MEPTFPHLRQGRTPSLLALAVLLTACGLPTTSSSRAEERSRLRLPAPRAAVFERGLLWIQGRGLPVVDLVEPDWVRAEWEIPGSGTRRGSLLLQIEDIEEDGAVTVLAVRGETYRGAGPVLERMDVNDPAVTRAVRELAEHLSCPAAEWDGCPET